MVHEFLVEVKQQLKFIRDERCQWFVRTIKVWIKHLGHQLECRVWCVQVKPVTLYSIPRAVC
jgi:hypothetical protein